MSKWITGFFRIDRNKNGFQILFVEDIPASPIANILYVVGEEGFAWNVAFLCPCGCNVLIQLNLLKDVFPSWKLFFHKNQVSISPSIRRTVGCKSHFVIKRGRIVWCGF